MNVLEMLYCGTVITLVAFLGCLVWDILSGGH